MAPNFVSFGRLIHTAWNMAASGTCVDVQRKRKQKRQLHWMTSHDNERKCASPRATLANECGDDGETGTILARWEFATHVVACDAENVRQ